ncbi:MAG: flavodoxin family protein [Clostridia bacterium]|nr:flavodoxin family protein [Clostridia bacterium]
MMNVVLISGSPRADGNTEQIIRACAATVEQAGLTPQIIYLRDNDIFACKACGYCKQNGKCRLDDCLNEIIEQVRGAKGLIVASPVYFGTARGDVMCLMQRLGMVSRSSDQFLDGMVGGPIAVARRGRQTINLSELLMFFFINGMIVPGSTYWNMVVGNNIKGSAMEDTEGINTVTAFTENLCNLIKKIN